MTSTVYVQILLDHLHVAVKWDTVELEQLELVKVHGDLRRRRSFLLKHVEDSNGIRRFYTFIPEGLGMAVDLTGRRQDGFVIHGPAES